MNKRLKFRGMLTLLLGLVCNVAWAALGTTKTGTPENGKKYYIYADTYSGGAYVNRYLYNDNGTLRMNAAVDESSDFYVWTCTVTNGKYTFQNVGNTAKYLAHKNVADAAYNFTLGKANANHEGTTIWSDAADRYLVAKNDGTAFDQSTSTYNQANDTWCTDYVFVEYVEVTGNSLNVTTNIAGAGNLMVNGEVTTLPYTLWQSLMTAPVTITATENNPYKFLGFFQGEENKGKELTIESLDANISYEARYEFAIFSADLNNPVPVRIYNSSNKPYAIRMNTAGSYSGNAVNSGADSYVENEIWYLVGNASSFKMYSKVAGNTLALKLAGTGSGSAATLAAEGTELCLVAQGNDTYGICPKGTNEQSFNMHGGAGQNIKLYAITDGNSKWKFQRINLSKSLKLSVKVEGTAWDSRYGVADLAFTINGEQSSSKIQGAAEEKTLYLPENATFSLSSLPQRGYTFNGFGNGNYENITLPAEGMSVTASYVANEEKILYHTPDANGKPYRIPAIATAVNGDIFAIADNRPCGNDIGYGEVDIKCRISKDNGATWSDEFFVADGKGGETNEMETGYGDAAIVADSRSNKLLVMMVCGRTVCHNGRWDASKIGNKTADAINRVARVYATYNETTGQWDWTQPEEVTDHIYSLFLNANNEPTVTSMFIGSGKICQSRVVKKGEYYRLYCSMWTRDGGNRVIYSDDFGGTWNVLGTINDRPASGGDEPKVEELPDGTVVLSSRKYSGRYFNLFKFDDETYTTGSWGNVAASNEVSNGLSFGGNSTNGEIYKVKATRKSDGKACDIMFQSIPTGSGRSDVAVYYKEMEYKADGTNKYTPETFSQGWTKGKHVSYKSSCYSTMISQADGRIAFLFEEEPGGYCIVYIPYTIEDLTGDNYTAYTIPQPTYGSEATPVWHNIKFGATGNALYDQGAGNNVATSTDAEADAAMWNIVGTQEQFYLVSKLGNYLAYDKANNRYTTTNNKKERVALTLKENIKGSWEIMRKGASKSLCEVAVKHSATGEVTEGTICGDANQIAFIDLTPAVYEPNIFSTEKEPVWFQVQFKAGGAYITDKGAGNNLQTAASTPGDAQCWQFIGSPEKFYMKSKKGNYVYFNNSRFATSSTEKTVLDLTKNAAEGYYEIGRTTTTSTFNQWGGAGAGKELGEWTAGDSNNPLCFMAEPLYPKFSNDDEDYWYYIQFGNGEYVIEDKGADADVKTAKLSSGNDAQLWKFTGSVTNCQIINKASGRYMVHDGTIKAKTTADGTGFKIVVTGNANFADMFEIQKAGSAANSNAFNMNGGAGTDKSIAFYTYGDGGNPLAFFTEESMVETFINEYTIAESNAAAPAEKLTLWYTQSAPATGVANTWMEYSLPIGNGQFGASLFGGVARDEILFNEKTLWSGGPGEYGYYLPFGSVYIDDLSGDFENASVQNYYRDLNLKTATGTMSYENAEGVKFTRQYIASNPDKAVVTKITASEAGKLSFRITMVSGKPTVKATTTYKNGYAQFSGKLQTVSYNATLKVVAKNGYVSTGTEGIIVEEADEVLIVLMGSTDFVGNDASHVNGRAPYLADDNKAIVDAVVEKGWDAVYAAHVADHQSYFNRVSLELDGVENNLPTNELIDAYNAASGSRNHMLEQLYYQYGRYLSIASSRGADSPANLQGIWNNTCTPPWHSDIHANINVQMNYWPVEAGNLSEMHEPFLNHIINEAAQSEWRALASNAVTELNKALSTSTAVREDSWTLLTENNIFGGISGFAPNYVIANAWYVTHMWQHYRYTLDKEYLAKAFPAMKGASLFWADRMIKVDITDEAGNVIGYCYECPNEYSPEHGPGSENAVAHAQQIAWESIDNTIKAADILGGVVAGIISQEDYELLKERLEKMDRGLAIEKYETHTTYKRNENGEEVVDYTWEEERNGIKVGDPILREWKYSRFYVSGDKGHRHMSHLMALYPFGQLTPADKELFEAAINSMKLRGDESTGWSMGWKINLWARALMPERSHAVLRKALKHSTDYGTNQGAGGIYYNLFDSHAPFQIDGNFGATSGVQEMLMQSHTEVIDILPALPAEWSKGSIKGLKAVGDFTVDIEWEGNQARKVTITNNQGQPCYVKCVGLSAAVVTVNGADYTLGEETTHGGLPCYQIASNAGDEIVIDLSNATQNDKTALKSLIAETKNLVNECYDYYTAEVEGLQTTDPEGDYYVWTNAQSTGEGSNGYIKDLVDGSNDTYFHSAYGNETITDGLNHHITIELGEGNEISSFKFKYVTRKGAGANFPAEIYVWGGVKGDNDEVVYEQLTTISSGLPQSAGATYTSSLIQGDKEYTHLRIMASRFFHMAELDILVRSEEYVNNYPNSVLVPAAVTAANAAVATAEEAVEAIQTVIEYTASLAALQTTYDELVAAMASGNLPVLLTSDVNKPYVYKIGIKRGDTKVLQLDYTGTPQMVAVADYSEGNKNQGWYFTKGSADGKVFIHPYLGGGDVLSAKSTSNSPAAVWAAVKGAETLQEWTIPVVDATNGTYNIKAGDGSNYFSNNGGTGNKMGFWSGSPSSDGGSLFVFTRVEFDGDIWKNCLEAYKTTFCTKENVVDGNTLGYYQGGAAYNEARTVAVEVLANEEAASEDCKSAYIALRSANEALVFLAPEAGKFYRIKSVAGWNDDAPYLGAANSTVSTSRAEFVATPDANTIFYFDGSSLLSYGSGLYLVSNSSFLGYNDVQTSGSKIGFRAAAKGLEGAFNISFNGGGRYLYANKSNYTDAGGSTNNDDGYCFNIEEVTSLPVIIGSVGFATLYAPVALAIPEGVTAYVGALDEEKYELTLTDVTEMAEGIPAETGVVLYRESTSADPITYYFDIVTDDVEAVESVFVGHKETVANSGNPYTLQTHDYDSDGVKESVAFKKYTGAKLTGFKAYLSLPAEGVAQAIGIRFEGTTDIEFSTLNPQLSTEVYDLMGRKVDTMVKGNMYIVNGKKVIVW